MKKRTWQLGFVLCLFAALAAGCKKNVGTSEDNAAAREEDADESLVYHFGFSCMTMENPYFIILEQSLRLEIEDAGHELITEDPKLDVEQQIRQIDEMIGEGIDAIFLCPVDWEAITPALVHLKEAGVRIINVDSELKEMDYADAYVGSNNKDAGYICGADLVEQCPDGGKIVILESPTQNSVNDRITGFEEAIRGKGFEIVARMDTRGDLSQAMEEAAAVFKEHSDITAVMCGNDQTALGAVVAANTAGLKDVMIYGVDGSPDLKKELAKKDTLIRGTSGQSPIHIGRDAAAVGIAMLNGDSYETFTYEDVFFIDADNVDMYGVDGWQ